MAIILPALQINKLTFHLLFSRQLTRIEPICGNFFAINWLVMSANWSRSPTPAQTLSTVLIPYVETLWASTPWMMRAKTMKRATEQNFILALKVGCEYDKRNEMKWKQGMPKQITASHTTEQLVKFKIELTRLIVFPCFE